MGQTDEDARITRRRKLKRAALVVGAIGIVGIFALPAVSGATERSYLKRCVEHRADTCAPKERREAAAFCRENPGAYADDTSPPVEYRKSRYGHLMTAEQKSVDQCETAHLYRHRNDGFLGGLIKLS